MASATSYTLTFTPAAGTTADYTLEVLNNIGTVLATKSSLNSMVTSITLETKRPGTFYLRVKTGGDIDPLATYTVSMTSAATGEQTSTTTTNTLNVAAAWNLLSSTTSVPAASFSDTAKFTSVWKWQNNNWAVYLPGEATTGVYASSKGFANLTAINPGEGFWVNSKAAASIDLTGTPEYGPLALTSGWNLVGLKSISPSSISTITSGQPQIISIWKWVNNNWAVSLPGEATPGAYATSKGFGNLTTINPGEGFWVNVGN